jgi:ArsR family transcriptional regulator, cadmium/lead-responsive transcriptional repressor
MTVAQRSDVAVAAQLFRGFGDPTRLAILTELLAGERRVVELVEAVGGSQSNVSGHLACLKECGLIADRPEGRAVHYRLATPAVVGLLRQAEVLLAEVGQQVALCDNYRTGDH